MFTLPPYGPFLNDITHHPGCLGNDDAAYLFELRALNKILEVVEVCQIALSQAVTLCRAKFCFKFLYQIVCSFLSFDQTFHPFLRSLRPKTIPILMLRRVKPRTSYPYAQGLPSKRKRLLITAHSHIPELQERDKHTFSTTMKFQLIEGSPFFNLSFKCFRKVNNLAFHHKKSTLQNGASKTLVFRS